MDDKKGVPKSQCIDVKVKVEVSVDPVSGKTTYYPKYHPEVIRPTENDAIINFKLVQPTPDKVRVISVTVKQGDNDQLSDPTISKNGKQVVLTDANTAVGKFNLQFKFGETSSTRGLAAFGGENCETDPVGDEYPEIDNAPPP